jgi:tetratricopeptide (TPR) repeat protein
MKLHYFLAAALCAAAVPAAANVTLVTPAANACANAAAGQSRNALTVGRLHDAVAVCSEALDGTLNDADSTATLINRGTLESAMNQTDAALSDFSAALARNPASDSALLNRGAALLKAARYDEARADFDRVIATAGANTAVAYFNRGIANEKSGDVVAAYHDYQQAVRLNPRYQAANIELARFHATDRRLADNR